MNDDELLVMLLMLLMVLVVLVVVRRCQIGHCAGLCSGASQSR